LTWQEDHLRASSQPTSYGQWTDALEGAANFKAIAKALIQVHFKGIAAIERAFLPHFTPYDC
jgi:sugar phosphate isomerase/epimerase